MNSNKKEEVINHFDEFSLHDKWSKLYLDVTNPENYDFVMRRKKLEGLLDPIAIPGRRVLDIGCGTGIMAHFFVGKGCQYIGTDASSKMIEQARVRHLSKKNNKIRFIISDVEELNFKDNCFDIILAAGLIEYFDNCSKALLEMIRILKPEGILIITLPRKCLNTFMSKRMHFITPLYHYYLTMTRRNVKPKYTIRHTLYHDNEIDTMLHRYGCRKKDARFYNTEVVFYPLNKLFPKTAFKIKQKAEKFSDSLLRPFSTGYIVSAEKCE